MKILGIESTCDETSCSIVENGETIHSLVTLSQIDLHKEFGGVFPEYASREHTVNMLPCIEKAVRDANMSLEELDRIAVAYTPGLMGSLLMGVVAAQTMAFSLDIPLIGINHIEAHLYAAMMGNKKDFPSLGVVLSGGHTFLVSIDAIGSYQLISTTVDDAIGESFDKVASMLGLPYPGGPHIEQLAQNGDKHAFSFSPGNVKKMPLHFSFSGLKTNVKYTIEAQNELTSTARADIAASFQKTAIMDITKKVQRAFCQGTYKHIYLGGGVTMNSSLREALSAALPDVDLFFPSKDLCMDNGAMIAGLAFHKPPTPIEKLVPEPRSLKTLVK